MQYLTYLMALLANKDVNVIHEPTSSLKSFKNRTRRLKAPFTLPDSSFTIFLTKSDIKTLYLHTISDSVLDSVQTTPLSFTNVNKPSFGGSFCGNFHCLKIE